MGRVHGEQSSRPPNVSSPHHLQVPAHKHALNLAQNFWPYAVCDSVWVRPGRSCPARLLPPLPKHGAAAGHRPCPHLLHQVRPRLPHCLPLLERLPSLGLGHGTWLQLLSSTSLATLWWACRFSAHWLSACYRLFKVDLNPDNFEFS